MCSEQDKITTQAKSDLADRFQAWSKDIEEKVWNILNSIKLIPSQKERIKLVMDKLFDGKDNESSVLNNLWNKFTLKDQEIAKSFKDLADKYNDDEQKLNTLLTLTRAILHAKPNTELLSVLYHYRSVILFEFGMFESCLEDVERISSLLLPQNFKQDYYYHKTTCHRKIAIKLLANYSPTITDESKTKSIKTMIALDDTLKREPIDRGNEICYQPPLPIIKKENALIPGLSDAVELNYTNELGRFITATRDISPGELIGVCKSHVTAIALSERLYFCWHCKKQVWNGVPCDRCPYVIYCSDYCREKSFEEYHDYECIVLPYIDPDVVFIMTLRITIQAYKECGCKIDKLISKYDINAELPTKDELFKSDHDPNKYLSIHLLSHKYNSLRNKSNSKFFTQSLTMAYYLGVSIGLVKLDESLSDLKKFDKFMYLLGFIERNMRIISVNCFFEKSLTISKKNYKITMNSKITPGAMHFKHQCYPNIERFYQGEYELIYVINGIKKGQMVGDNYLYHFSERKREERRETVELLFGNNYCCNCDACINDWSLDHSKPTGIDQKEWEKLKKDIYNVGKRVQIMHEMASDYLRKHGKICDATKYVNDLVEIMKTCQKYLKPNSADFYTTQYLLGRAIGLTHLSYVIPE